MKKELICFAMAAIPGAALAQNVGVNGAACSFSSVKAAVDSLGTSAGTVFVRENMDHDVPVEIMINGHVTIRSSNANCTAAGTGRATLRRAGGPKRIMTVNTSKSATLIDLMVRGGSETEGGNVFVKPYGDLILEGTYMGFASATRGGSVFLDENADLEMGDDSRIYANDALEGGGIYASRNSEVTVESGGYIGRNHWENLANFGAGIYADRSTLRFEAGSRVEYNDARDYGGGVFQLGTETTVFGTFIGNQADVGGGIQAGFGFTGLNETINVNGSAVFEANIARAGGGGGIAGLDGDPGSQVTLNSARFEENEASSGGALGLGAGFEVDINSSSFYRNVATNEGGALAYNSDTLEIDSSSYFEANEAARGGALHLRDGDGNIAEVEGWYVGNEASERGGAIHQASGTVRVHNGKFHGNTAELGGGAINVAGAGSLLRIAAPPGASCALALGCAEFDGNSTTTGIGGALRLESGEVIARRSLMDSNTAPTGSAVGMASGTLTLTGARISYNTDTAGGIDAAVDISAGSINVSNNTIVGNSRGGARISGGVSGSFNNNIVFFNLAGALVPAAVTTTCNDTQGAPLPGAGNISIAPMLNPNGSQAAGSAGIDACSAGFGRAIDGVIRAVGAGPTPFDMGCFEQ